MPSSSLRLAKPDELVPDHLLHRPVRLLSRVDQDQHADDHGAIRLDLHTVVLIGEQVPAAEELLERAEEHLDHPPQPIHLHDEFGREVEPIRNQSEHPVAVRPQRSSGALMRLHRDTDQPHGMIRSRAMLRLPAQIDDLVADHVGGSVGVRQVVDVRDSG